MSVNSLIRDHRGPNRRLFHLLRSAKNRKWWMSAAIASWKVRRREADRQETGWIGKLEDEVAWVELRRPL